MDLSVFGTSDRGQLSEMAVTIIGPLRPVMTTGTADPAKCSRKRHEASASTHVSDNS